MVYNFFDKKSSRSGVDAELNYHVANELPRQIIRKLKRRKVYSLFRDNIWGVDLADIQSLNNTINESSIYRVQLICLENIHVLLLFRAKEELVSLMHFKKRRKPNKIWIDQGGELY